ncbi:MAG: right-handed parallel beta-helix repeat-containing protein [Deltaproteobacteria bacterium]|nr:right-handed parallel beta-helix repeat-containing protein [Deltaproteobacteria bacterium]
MKRITCLPILGLLALSAFIAPVPVTAATLTVTTESDLDLLDGLCSLREALVAANSDSPYQDCPEGNGADEILLEVAGTYLLLLPLPVIEDDLKVTGLGADLSILDGGDTVQILNFSPPGPGNGEVLRLEGLQLTGGRAAEGGAIRVARNRGLEIDQCVLVGNVATLQGGAIAADRPSSVLITESHFLDNVSNSIGGAMAVEGGTTFIEDSTFERNLAETSTGGAIYALVVTDLSLSRVTLSGNRAAGDGGALVSVASQVTLESCTVTENQTDFDGDDDGDGGGLSIAGQVSLTLSNTILAGNLDTSPAAEDCRDGHRKLGASIVTSSANAIGTNDCFDTNFPAGLPNVNGDWVGTVASPFEPLLHPLAFNGGPTPTHLPFAASPVVDQGSCTLATHDQRGFGNGVTGLRIIDDPDVPDLIDGCDIGAVEVHSISLEGLVFVDGFETGDTSRWSLTVQQL